MKPYTPPQTFFRALDRYQQTVKNIDRINRQLDDVQRQLTFESRQKYHEWRHSAALAREHFHEERELLLKWMDDRDSKLMRNMYHLLMDFVGNGDDLSSGEKVLIDDVRAYFDTIAKMAS